MNKWLIGLTIIFAVATFPAQAADELAEQLALCKEFRAEQASAMADIEVAERNYEQHCVAPSGKLAATCEEYRTVRAQFKSDPNIKITELICGLILGERN